MSRQILYGSLADRVLADIQQKGVSIQTGIIASEPGIEYWIWQFGLPDSYSLLRKYRGKYQALGTVIVTWQIAGSGDVLRITPLLRFEQVNWIERLDPRVDFETIGTLHAWLAASLPSKGWEIAPSEPVVQGAHSIPGREDTEIFCFASEQELFSGITRFPTDLSHFVSGTARAR